MSDDKKTMGVCFYMTRKFENNQVYTKCKNASLNKCPVIKFIDSTKESYNYKLTNKLINLGDKVILIKPTNTKIEVISHLYFMGIIDDICNKCEHNVKTR